MTVITTAEVVAIIAAGLFMGVCGFVLGRLSKR